MKVGESYRSSDNFDVYKTIVGVTERSYAEWTGTVKHSDTFLVVAVGEIVTRWSMLLRTYKVLAPAAFGWTTIGVDVDDTLDTDGVWRVKDRYIKREFP